VKISITVDGFEEAMRSIRQLQVDPRTMRKAWDTVGQYMVRQTVRERFDKERSPDGIPWKKRSEATQRHYIRVYGLKFAANKVLQFTGELKKITYAADENGVVFGTNLKYGRTHQYGAKKGEFGTAISRHTYKDNAENRRLGRVGAVYTREHPIPWGDIPARPFLGITKHEMEVIQTILIDHIQNAPVSKAGWGKRIGEKIGGWINRIIGKWRGR
jgi:phage gpG-like protein